MTHTWDLYLHYEICPHCGLIIERREEEIKEMSCPKCNTLFKIEKSAKKQRGPIFGKHPKPEFDWY